MLQGTPSQELDRIIEAASAAQVTLRRMLEGIVPDENGVVTVTTEAAAERAAELREQLDSLVDTGYTIAGSVEDLHPATGGSYTSLQTIEEGLAARLERGSVGHNDEELAAVDHDEASVAVEITPAEDRPSGPSYYGV